MKEVSHGTNALQDEKCPIYALFRKNSPVPVASIVEVPEIIGYGSTSCRESRVAAQNILKLYTERTTLFQMEPWRCDL